MTHDPTRRSPPPAAGVSAIVPARPWLALSLLTLALAALAGGCGGGDADPAAAPPVASPAPPPAHAPAPAPPPPTGLAGTVAVGAPMTGATLRVVDATGTVVAADVPVDAQGRYTIGTLPGTAPWRVEACGFAGATWQCHHTVVATAGTAHVTPLTTATVLLASGRSPAELMAPGAGAPAADAVERAQAQLRAALGDTLTSAVPAGFDFLSGDLAAGSRTGYDRLLDALGVATGEDTRAFVQVTPRLGSGNLYLEPGATAGRLVAAPNAPSVDLAGIEALFAGLNRAVASRAACLEAGGGLAQQLATQARLDLGGEVVRGAQAVALAFCGFFEMENLWGARFVSPVLGRCELGGAQPLCRIGFALQRPGDGEVESVGDGFAAVFDDGRWKLAGDADPVAIRVAARVQRDRRIDGDQPFDTWDRALSIEVPAIPGLACARVSQRDAGGALVPLALLKPFAADGAPPSSRLSMWRAQPSGASTSLDPAAGLLRNGDDSWLHLPDGDAGDVVVRHFLRGGRTVTVALFGDAGCTAPFAVEGRSSFEIEVGGVPPVSAALASLPWPDLTPTARDGLRRLAVAAGGGGASLDAAWTFPRGRLGVREAVFCTDRPSCGEGGAGRAGERGVRAGATTVSLALTPPRAGIGADAAKVLMLHGTAADGTGLSAVFLSCPATPAGQRCRD